MEESYIKDKEWVKCSINGVTYHCHLEYNISHLISKPWVRVTVRKYIQKSWWFFKWKEEEFECNYSPDITLSQYRLINDVFYFKSEYVKGWVQATLNWRESKIRENNKQKYIEKNLKVVKEI